MVTVAEINFRRSGEEQNKHEDPLLAGEESLETLGQLFPRSNSEDCPQFVCFPEAPHDPGGI